MDKVNKLIQRFAIHSRAGRSGFTLVELIIGIALAALVGAGIVAVLTHCLSGWSKGVGTAYAECGGDLVLQRLLKEIEDGKTASVGEGALTVTFPLVRTDPGSGETYYDRDAGGEVRTYFIQDGALVRQVGSAVTIMSRGVESVSFAATGDTVAITLTTKEQVGADCVTRQFSARVALRNKRST